MGVIVRIIEIIIELWIPALTLLVGLTIVLGRKRIWTVLALVAVGLFGIGIFKRLTAPPEPGVASVSARVPRASLASAIESLEVDQATIGNLQITGSTAPWRFSGEITSSASEHTLISATVNIVRRDCYEGALDPSGCVVLWKGSKRVGLDVPPGETRRFVEPISPRGSVPRARGKLQDEFELVALNGRRLADETNVETP